MARKKNKAPVPNKTDGSPNKHPTKQTRSTPEADLKNVKGRVIEKAKGSAADSTETARTTDTDHTNKPSAIAGLAFIQSPAVDRTPDTSFTLDNSFTDEQKNVLLKNEKDPAARAIFLARNITMTSRRSC
jgi:hypothetical protein